MLQNYLLAAKGGGPKKKQIPPTPDEQFANWTGSGDTKVMAQDLMKRGLVGADQIVNDVPNTSTRNGIINSQADWKPAAIQQILANAHRLGIRTPEAVMANRNVLIGNPRWRDAINDPTFNNIHPNFWTTITHSILPEQWAKFDAQNKNNVAKK